MMDLDRFRIALKAHRNKRNLSQERLAERAEMDHSLVSRLEGGQREPTREAIDKLATGLLLTDDQHDDLLVLAGYTPNNPANLLRGDPELGALYTILHDDGVSAVTKTHLREALRGIAGAVTLRVVGKAAA